MPVILAPSQTRTIRAGPVELTEQLRVKTKKNKGPVPFLYSLPVSNVDFWHRLDNCPVMLTQPPRIQALLNEIGNQSEAMPHGQGLLGTQNGQISPGKVQDKW